MTITVKCKCGKSFQVKDELAGRPGTCKACGAKVTISHVSHRDGKEGDAPQTTAKKKQEPRRCPACNEVVKKRAKECRHCGVQLPQPQNSKPANIKGKQPGGKSGYGCVAIMLIASIVLSATPLAPLGWVGITLFFLYVIWDCFRMVDSTRDD